jgi:HK97 family phage portal protein
LAAAVSIWFRPKEDRRKQFAPTPYPALAPVGNFADVALHSAESSLQSIAVHSSADLIASLCSELPFTVYSGEGAQRRARQTPSYLLDPSGEGQGVEDWGYQVLMSWLLRGNVFGDVLERRAAVPTQVLLHHPDDVHGWVDAEGHTEWTVCGEQVTDLARWLHRRVNPIPGRVLGLSPIGFHASTIGLSITSVRFGESWFRDGAHPSALLTNELSEMDEPTARKAKERFLAALRGTREPVVLGKGWKYEKIQISPEESQFLETQGYTEAQCARMFGPGIAEVLGYDTGKSLTYSNIESRSAHLLVYTVNKWLRRYERLLSLMLPRPQYVVIDRDGILQSTTLERYRSHDLALRGRWKTVNDIREVEKLPPVAWGDEPNPAGGPAPADPETSDVDTDEDKEGPR